MSKELRNRSVENSKFGITKGYIERWDYSEDKNNFISCYYARCGYQDVSYGLVFNHVNKCMICKRLLGLSKSQVKNTSEIVTYFLLNQDIPKIAKDPYGRLATNQGYNINNNEESNNFSKDFKSLKSYSNIVAIRKGNLIIRNYEYRQLTSGGYFGGLTDKALTLNDYKRKAESLGLYDLKYCDLPIDRLTNIADQEDKQIIDIEIIEPKQDQYYTAYGYDHEKEKSIDIVKKVDQNNYFYLNDQFFKVVFENKETKEKVTRKFIWIFDETAKCLIEVDPNCERYQDALFFLYPKEIKNRSGTLRQGEFFVEPTNLKFKPYKAQFEDEKFIKDKKEKISNHKATNRIVLNEENKPNSQYVTGTVRHTNKDHRMLKLKKGIWYKVHESNKINAWSINLRTGGGFD